MSSARQPYAGGGSDMGSTDASRPLMAGGSATESAGSAARRPTVKVDAPSSVAAADATGSDSTSGSQEGGDKMATESDQSPKDVNVRANWGGQIEFILTCIGYAVGLGNVWRFPYLAYKNGGGAFLIPYFFMLATVGLPLFFMELSFGQFASLGPITIWKINPMFKGLGFSMVVISWFIGLYYNVVIAHVLFYFAASLTTELPWKFCNNHWNTPCCIDSVPRHNDSSSTGSINNGSLIALSTTVTPLVHTTAELVNSTVANATVANASFCEAGRITATEEYYNHFVLEMSSSITDMGSVSWKLALSLLVAWAMVLLVLIRGIQSLGKVAYFTAIFPYVMLTVLLVRGATLEGAMEGVKYYLTPNWERLADATVWQDAATQIFYSLSVCTGGLVAMASFNKFNNNCRRDSLIVALINAFTSVYAGFVIFSVLGFMAVEKGVPVSKVAQGGPGLAFVVYPEALARMPVAPMWSVFFFLMMATLGFGSIFSIVETIIAAFTDEFHEKLHPRRNNIIFRVAVCASMYLLGLPMVSQGGIFLLNLVDASVSGFPLLIVGFFEIAALAYIYGYKRFAHDIELMLGSKPNIYWKACWLGVSPVVLVVTVVFACSQYKSPTYGSKSYPDWALALGWLICIACLLPTVVWALYYYCKNGGLELLRVHTLPLGHWGPALADDRRGRYVLFPSSKPSVTVDGAEGNGIQWDEKFGPGNIKSLNSIVSLVSVRKDFGSSEEQPMASLLSVNSRSRSPHRAGGSGDTTKFMVGGPDV